MIPDFESRFNPKDFSSPTRLLCSRGLIFLEDNKFFFSSSYKISSHKTDENIFLFLRTRNLLVGWDMVDLLERKAVFLFENILMSFVTSV